MASATELGREAELELSGFGGLFRAREKDFFLSLLALLSLARLCWCCRCVRYLYVGFGEEIGGRRMVLASRGKEKMVVGIILLGKAKLDYKGVIKIHLTIAIAITVLAQSGECFRERDREAS